MGYIGGNDARNNLKDQLGKYLCKKPLEKDEAELRLETSVHEYITAEVILFFVVVLLLLKITYYLDTRKRLNLKYIYIQLLTHLKYSI